MGKDIGKIIFVAVVAAVLSSVGTTLVMSSLDADRQTRMEARAREIDARLDDEADAVEVMARRVDQMQKSLARAGLRRLPPGTSAETAPDGDTAAAGPAGELVAGALAPDGTPYVSRAELEKYFEEKGAEVLPGTNWTPPTPKTLEEVAAEMNLGTGEEAALRSALRESEEEFITAIFGDRPIEDIRQDLLNAKDDPELQGQLIQRAFTRGFSNIGKILTIEKRKKRRVRDILGDERGNEFLQKPVKPILGDEFEKVFEETFE